MNAIYDLIYMIYINLYQALYDGLSLIPLLNVEIYIYSSVIDLASIISSMVILLISYYVAYLPFKLVKNIYRRMVG